MKIKSIKIENILSIESITLNFDNCNLMLIDGWNHDLNRANGAGKSAIFNSISFAIYNKLPRKITKTEIIRRGCKQGYAEVELEIGNDVYSIKRGRPIDVIITKNSSVVQMTQEELEDIIGLSYDQFITTMYSAQNTSQRFVFLNDSDKKQFILDLMKLNDFSTHHKTVKEMLSKSDIDLALKQVEIDSLRSKSNIYRESLINKDEVQLSLTNNCAKIQTLNKTLIELSNINKPNLDRYEDIESKLRDAKLKLASIKGNRSSTFSRYNELKRKLSAPFKFNGGQPSTCPSCKEPMIIQDGNIYHKDLIDTASLKAHESYDKENISMTIEQAQLKSQLDEYDKELAKEHQIDAMLIKSNLKKKQDTKAYDDAQSSIANTRYQIKQLESDNKQLTDKLNNNNSIMNKIRAITDQASALVASKESILGSQEMLKACANIYSPTGAQAYIMDAIIDLFNTSCEEYIGLIWSNASYKLQTHKINSDKSVTAKFSEELIIDGKEVSIGSLSGGELRSLSLAVDFAIIDVVSSHFGINMSPIILDEAFDGLDAVGRELVIELLSKVALNKQIVIVEHATESKSLFSKVILVEKRNGISFIA